VLGVVEHRRVHGRHAEQRRDAVAFDDRERLGGIEAGQERQARADAHAAVQAGGQPEDVEERQPAQGDHLRAGVDEIDRDVGRRVQIAVRELRPLRRARRSRRVEDQRGVVVVAIGELTDRLGLAQRLLERPALDEHALGAGLGSARLRGRGEPVPGHQDAGAGVAEVEGDLALLQKRVHRDDDRPEPQGAEECEREVGEVGKHEADAVAGSDALRGEQPGDAGAGLVEDGVRQLELVELEGGPIAVFGDRVGEHLGQVRHRGSSLPRGYLAISAGVVPGACRTASDDRLARGPG
jgi:hypothetical protein